MSLSCIEVVPEAHHETLHKHIFELRGLDILQLGDIKVKEARNHNRADVFNIFKYSIR